MAYSPRTNEFLVNTNAPGEQGGIAATRLADGRYLAVWHNTLVVNGTTMFVLRGQFYGPEGAPVGSEVNLTDLSFRGQFNPDVTALPNGGFAISWTQFVSNGYQSNLRLYNAAGTVTTAVPLAFNAEAAELAALPSGAVVAVWTSSSLNMGVTGIGGSIVQPGGSAQTLTLPYDGTGLRSSPDVAVLANGTFVVTWAESDAGGTGFKGHLFSSTGAPLGSEFEAGRDIAALPGGGFVAFSGNSGQVYDNSGGKVGPAFPVSGVTEVTVTENGGFFVVWTTNEAGSGAEVRGQEFAADGTKIGPELLINQLTAGDQFAGAIAGGANGSDIFIAWNDQGVGDGSGSAVRGRVYTDALQGSGGAETLVGTPGNDEILAYGGNDTVLAQQGGDDIVKGGDGDDIIYFGAAFTPADRVDGGAGRNTLVLQGVYPLQVLDAASMVNIETLSLMTASDNVFGGATNGPNSYAIQTSDGNVAAGQTLTLEARALQPGEAVNFNGQAETDGKFALYGGRGNDTLLGGAGNDMIDGGAGIDTMNGGLGDDIYFVDNGSDGVQDSGPGFDAVYTSVSYTLAAAAAIELLATTNSGSTTGVQLTGNDFAQTIVGTNGADTLNGGTGGNDYLIGNGGDDTLTAFNNSVLAGGTGNDTYFVRDWFQVLNESAGQGFDRVFVQSSFVLLGDVEVEELIYQGTGPGAVALYGNGFGQKIEGSAASDELYGFGGNDTLVGNAGNDTLDGGAGADVMEGGAGGDIYFVDNAGDAVNDVGAPGDYNSVYASASFALSAAAPISLLATTDSSGTTAIDLTGSSSAQTIIGNNGANRLLGLGGNDFLGGGGGADTLDGGAGDDILEGGSGADVFRFAATSDIVVSSGDQIRDFLSGTDKIDLSLIDANTSTAGDQAFTYIGTGAFTGQAGQLRHEVANGQVHISGDVDGDGLADFQIVLNNTTIVAASDFVF